MIKSKKKIDVVNMTFFLQTKDYKINILEATKENSRVQRERVFNNTFSVDAHVKISFFYFAVCNLKFCRPTVIKYN